MTGEIKKEKEKANSFLRVGVLGALGSGKTTVGKLLNEEWPKSALVEENFGQNPFLAQFYENPHLWSFHSQMWFLVNKIKQLTGLKRRGVQIIDPPLEMDRLYALTQFQMGWMNKDEWDLYEKGRESLIEEKKIRPPDIYFAAVVPEEILLQRIARRAMQPERSFERWIMAEYPDYPVNLARNVSDWARQNAGMVPILTIDTSVADCSTRAGRIAVAGFTRGFINQVLSERTFFPS